MKYFRFLPFLLCAALFGCLNSGPLVQPFMGILDAYKIGNGPAETSQYQVVVHYEDVVPGKYEVKVGFGYIPTAEDVKIFAQDALGIYAVAHTEVLQKQAGDLRLTLDPSVVRNLQGKLDGKIHAILSKYPHGKEWPTVKHDVFVLPPQSMTQ
ncbi:hypothetical protein DB347_03880 [Opitutaceae bacterium EW11]|nr:hypothetical protein DB347_03880 [Opitutaceae bacterium EW11]